MEEYILKSALVAEIKRRISEYENCGIDNVACNAKIIALQGLLIYINIIEVKDPYEQCIQYDSIKAGIQAHAETYSFNIESELFHQLAKEQQKLWRKEIEQACISGGEMGVELARDQRYKENLEVKEVDLDGISRHYALNNSPWDDCRDEIQDAYKAGFELGLKAQKGE